MQYHVPAHLNWDLWLGPVPYRPYAPEYAPFNWRGWWDFGTGALGDIACHSMDAAFWTLDLKYPTRIEAESTELFPETAPQSSRIVFYFPERNGRAPVTVVWRDGGLLPPRPEEIGADEPWDFPSIGGQLWVGDDGKLVAGVYGEDPRLVDRERHAALQASPPAEKYPRTEGVYAEWIAACKGGPPAGSNFADHAGPLTEMVLLGNLAVRSNRNLDLNPTTGAITNVAIPDEFVRPEYREGWRL